MNSVTGAYQPPDLAELAGFDTPTICNAIELFEVRSPTAGYMDRRIAACFPDLPITICPKFVPPPGRFVPLFDDLHCVDVSQRDDVLVSERRQASYERGASAP
jgi:hypothetical protein